MAMPPAPDTLPAEPRVALPAVARALRRMARSAAAPWLHGEIARRMAERLPLIRKPVQHVVDWWGFTSGSGPVLAAAYPHARRTIVEPLPELHERSLAASAAQSGTTVCATDDGGLSGADLLWANMMLHAIARTEITLARWNEVLAVDGFVMFSAFGPDTVRELRDLYRANSWGDPACAFIDMHDLGDLLVRAGFADPVMDMERITLTWPDAPSLLRELRALGANAHPRRSAGLHTPRWQRTLEQQLQQQLADVDGRLALTFEIVYGHAFKAAPRRAGPQETSVPLDALRATLGRRPKG
jgi:malonyl-CoA O-methyltransferase